MVEALPEKDVREPLLGLEMFCVLVKVFLKNILKLLFRQFT